ncbi:MAG: PKD domain-containing protein [Planctomycetes bacterium]|nr:PKD domain-containing protein [Planctomycetota bacterium]
MKLNDWAIGVTAAPRDPQTLPRTLASLEAAGFPRPRVFADGDLEAPAGYEATRRSPAVGGWPNFWLAATELVARQPGADAYLLVQDDVIFSAGVFDYVSRFDVPDDCGVLSLFCPACHNRDLGWFAIPVGYGMASAQALAFPRERMYEFLAHPWTVNHRRNAPKSEHFRGDGLHHIDGVVGEWCRLTRRRCYCHSPSLSQHVGRDSVFFDPGAADTHTFYWEVSGPGVFLQGTGQTISFVPPDNGVYTGTFTVVDDDSGGGFDTVAITVNNLDPVGDAGPDQSAFEGDTVTLSGSLVSDPGTADTHSFQWQVSGPGLSITGPGPAFAFKPPDNGLYTGTLTTTDDDGGSHSDTVAITVANVPPVADAGADQTVNEGDTVTLSGSFTDPGAADTHTFQWEVSGPGVSESGTGLTISFTPPDNGVYTGTFTVTDDDGGVDSDTATITALNVAPTLELNATTAIPEGGAATIGGNVDDPGTADTITLESTGATGRPWRRTRSERRASPLPMRTTTWTTIPRARRATTTRSR